MPIRNRTKNPSFAPVKNTASPWSADSPLPTRRQFLRTAAGTGLALGTSPLTFADHHGHPTPTSITSLDRRRYIQNMELLALFAPGQHRGATMQMMWCGP